MKTRGMSHAGVTALLNASHLLIGESLIYRGYMIKRLLSGYSVQKAGFHLASPKNPEEAIKAIDSLNPPSRACSNSADLTERIPRCCRKGGTSMAVTTEIDTIGCLMTDAVETGVLVYWAEARKIKRAPDLGVTSFEVRDAAMKGRAKRRNGL